MSTRTIRLLHVEDDAMQQRVIAHHLKAIPEFAFVITAVVSEGLAMQLFRQGQFDLVLLDYQLVQGDGMHLLSRLRALDPVIPIIAISGKATSEIAAHLVQAGADDYFDKRELNSAKLATSIRSALRRAEAVRNKLASQVTDRLSEFTIQLTKLCADYVRRMGVDFLAQLDVIAKDMKTAGISANELQQMHENGTAQLEVPLGGDPARRKLQARPLLFELLLRVCDDPYPNAERKA